MPNYKKPATEQEVIAALREQAKILSYIGKPTHEVRINADVASLPRDGPYSYESKQYEMIEYGESKEKEQYFTKKEMKMKRSIAQRFYDECSHKVSRYYRKIKAC